MASYQLLQCDHWVTWRLCYMVIHNFWSPYFCIISSPVFRMVTLITVKAAEQSGFFSLGSSTLLFPFDLVFLQVTQIIKAISQKLFVFFCVDTKQRCYNLCEVVELGLSKSWALIRTRAKYSMYTQISTV